MGDWKQSKCKHRKRYSTLWNIEEKKKHQTGRKVKQIVVQIKKDHYLFFITLYINMKVHSERLVGADKLALLPPPSPPVKRVLRSSVWSFASNSNSGGSTGCLLGLILPHFSTKKFANFFRACESVLSAQNAALTFATRVFWTHLNVFSSGFNYGF